MTPLLRVYAEARIVEYQINFDNLYYKIFLHNASLETVNGETILNDFYVEHVIHTSQYEEMLTVAFTRPELIALEASWRSQEDNCYFEKVEGTFTALMTLNGGTALLIPLPMNDFFQRIRGK